MSKPVKSRKPPRDETGWLPVPLKEFLRGEPEPPSLLERSDGASMLYPGKLHVFQGEPESGKGWLAHVAASQVIAEGENVLYIDYEDDATTAVERQIALGTGEDEIVARLHYVQPYQSIMDGWDYFAEVLQSIQPALAILDGLTEAYSLEGLDSNDGRDVATWLHRLPRKLARRGAAVVQIDHVTKAREGRGRYSIGSQHKLAGVDVAYSVENKKPFGRGRAGKSLVTIQKDRKGWLRRRADNKVFATLALAESEGSVQAELIAPELRAFKKPTEIMQLVSRALEEEPGLSVNAIKKGVTGRGETIGTAIELHTRDKYIELNDDEKYVSVRPYEGEND